MDIEQFIKDRDKRKREFLKLFFIAFDEYDNCDLSKKSSIKITAKYKELAQIIVATRKSLEDKPELRDGLSGQVLEYIYHIAELLTNPVLKGNLMQLMLLEECMKKFNKEVVI